MIKYTLMLCFAIIVLSSCGIRDIEGTQERDVEYCYMVKGDSTDVTINYFGKNGPVTQAVNVLPWKSEEIVYHIGADSVLGCIIEAIDNSSIETTLTVEIYVDGKLEATKSKTGSNCSVYLDYTVYP